MGKNPFIRFIGYYIPAGNFPRRVEAAPPHRRLCRGGPASSAPCPSVGTREGGIAPPAPKSLLSRPWGGLGSCWGIATLLAAHSPGKASVCSPLESTPPFWVSVLGFDQFWGGGAKRVPAPVVLLEGALCHGHQRGFGL